MSLDRFALAPPAGVWSRLGWSLWPSRCLLCGEPGLPGGDVCAACWAQWPRAGRSCLGCAMPLAGAAADTDPACGYWQPAVPAPGDERLQTDEASADGPPPPRLAPVPPPERCGACRGRASPLDEVRAACLYRAPLDRLLPRFKFHRDLVAGRLLATTMAAAFAAPAAGLAAAGAATLVPVPLHRSRLRGRGYDQALELARPLARRLRLPLCADGLYRARDTLPQSRLDAAGRRRNLRQAFAWRASVPPPTHAILIDDVMTTGATLEAAARALRRAGAHRVEAWVCARAL